MLNFLNISRLIAAVGVRNEGRNTDCVTYMLLTVDLHTNISCA